MSRSVVAAMRAYTLEAREASVKLNQNESPFDFPRALKEQALARVAESEWNRYPDFEATELRNAVARFAGVTADNILVGNGSNELLAATIGTFVGPGTPVVFPLPTFALYEKLVTIAGGLPLPIEIDPATGLLPVEAMLDAIAAHDDAVAIVCSPNNPTGGVLPRGGLDALLQSGAMVLLDRAYCDFEREAAPDILHPNLVTFRTFSKAFGLAALRIGWLSSTADNCREIRKVKLPYALNVVSETIAAIALENREVRDRNVAAIIAERQRVLAAMGRIPAVTIFPTAANFVTFRVTNTKELFGQLLARDILIRDVSSYARLQNCLRVSIGSREQNDAFLAALTEAL
jgi:histidinol-phosphate aminotransferase